MIQEMSCGIMPLRKNQDGEYEVILVQSKKGRHRWFPKWWVEEQELPIETAKREVQEETGITFDYIDPKVFKEQYQFARNEKPVDKQVWYFVGIVENNKVTIDPKEIKAYIRLLLKQVREKLTFYSTRRVRDKALKYLLNG